MRNNVITMNTTNATRENTYNLIMANTIPVGNKRYANILTDEGIIFADKRIQRDNDTTRAKKKIRNLAENWDINKMDALKVVPHPEEHRFSLVDGYHRLSAAIIKGEKSLVCEIITGLSDNPEERIIQEATLFATQNDEVDVLSPIERHKANVLRGIKENVIVDDLCNKYNIALKKNPSHGRTQTGQLAGFTMALQFARTAEKEILDRTFCILCESRWNIAKLGLSANTIHMVANILKLHPEYQNEICSLLIKEFTPIEPEQLFSQAYSKYPARKEKERNLLYLEDVVCENLGITRVYSGGKVSLKTA